MKVLYATLLLFLASFSANCQTQINPAQQINWPYVTGTVNPSSPTWVCSPANYGQPYTNSVTGAQFTCAAPGWVSVSGGGGGGGSYPIGTGIVTVIGGAGWGTTLAAPSSSLVGVSDSQTLSNKNIAASEVNSGTLPHAQLPILLGSDIPNNSANTTGNAATATAFGTVPQQCGSSLFMTGAQANGNANCGAVFPSGTPAQILLYGSSGTSVTPTTVSQDVTISASGVATVHSIGGVAFAASATVDATNATNIATGTLAAARVAVLNPSTQLAWPSLTGAANPASSCTSANYGQPYTNLTTNVQFVCASSGWLQTTGFPFTLGSTSIGSGATVTSVSGLTVDGVTPVVLGYVDFSSSGQTRINGKASLASPTFTGTVTIPSGGVLSTPASLTLTNATGLPLTTGVTGLLPVTNGGSGTASPGLVQGTNVTITGTWPNQTINASGGGGSMTWPSVPGIASCTGTPCTAWGTSYSSTNTIPANVIATLNQSTTGTAANLSGTPALPNGTTATTQSPGDSTTKLATDAFVIANAGGTGFPITLGSTSVASSSTTTTITGLTLTSAALNGTLGATTPAAANVTTLTASAGVIAGADGVHPGVGAMVGNTTEPTLAANTFNLIGPSTASFTALGWQFPSTTNASAGIVHAAADVSGISLLSVSPIVTADIPANTITLALLATQATNTVLMNATGGTAVPTAVAMPTCTTGADLYNTSTNTWSCVSTGGLSPATYFATTSYTSEGAAVGTANHSICSGVIIPQGGLSVGHIAFHVDTGDGGGAVLSDVGIYSTDGTLVAHIGATSLNTTTDQFIALSGGTQTIPAGPALACYTSTGTTLALVAVGSAPTIYGMEDAGFTTTGGALNSTITFPTLGSATYSIWGTSLAFILEP